MKAKAGSTSFRNILVPTDGSRLSQRAVRDAIGFARAAHAKVTALHVIPPYQPPIYAEGYVSQAEVFSANEYERAAREQAARMLEKVAALARDAQVPCETVSVEGAPAWKGIVETARRHRCDLIMMASHGRKGIEALILGSETRKVLTHTKTPVLVCR